MSEDDATAWDDARRAIDDAQSSASADQALPHLRAARDSLDALINDTLAETILGGVSMRSAAALAGFAENTIRPRLGQSGPLAPYADANGTVSASSIARARHDYSTTDGLVDVTAVSGQMTPFVDPTDQERKPLTFTPRTPKKAYSASVRKAAARVAVAASKKTGRAVEPSVAKLAEETPKKKEK